MICKKTKQILRQREAEKLKKQKEIGQIEQEIRIAVSEKICPYCANETSQAISWSEAYICKKCNKKFISRDFGDSEIKDCKEVNK